MSFNLTPLTRFHTEDSGLSKNLTGARPIEPFLLFPEEIEAACPEPLRPLLRQVLAIRAPEDQLRSGLLGSVAAGPRPAGALPGAAGLALAVLLPGTDLLLSPGNGSGDGLARSAAHAEKMTMNEHS